MISIFKFNEYGLRIVLNFLNGTFSTILNIKKEQSMKIRILPREYIIAMIDFTVDTYYSEFILRALRIENNAENNIEIQEIAFLLMMSRCSSLN